MHEASEAINIIDANRINRATARALIIEGKRGYYRDFIHSEASAGTREEKELEIGIFLEQKREDLRCVCAAFVRLTERISS